jgi:non-ribosomal peptide synthetase component F
MPRSTRAGAAIRKVSGWIRLPQSTGSQSPEIAFDPDLGVYGGWYPDGVTNTCHNCLDRHVSGGRGDQAAIIYDSPITGAKRTISYAEMLAEVEALPARCRDKGVGKGDRVIIYMPMVPEALVAMLACARLGASIRWCLAVLPQTSLPPASRIARPS